MKQPIFMARGTTQTLNIDLATAGFGEDYILSENEVIRFGVKKHPNDSNCLIKKELTNANYENGVYVLILSPSDTESLPFGTYYYDVGVQNGADYFNVIECSRFSIRYNITSREVVE